MLTQTMERQTIDAVLHWIDWKQSEMNVRGSELVRAGNHDGAMIIAFYQQALADVKLIATGDHVGEAKIRDSIKAGFIPNPKEFVPLPSSAGRVAR